MSSSSFPILLFQLLLFSMKELRYNAHFIKRNTSWLYVGFIAINKTLSRSMAKSKWNNCVVIRKILLFTCDRASHSIKLVLNAKIFTIYWFLTTLLLLLDFCIGKGLEMIGSGCRGLFHLFKRKETSLKILLSVCEI